MKKLGLGLAGLGVGSTSTWALPQAPEVPAWPLDLPLRLNANENPLGPSPAARAAMAAAVNQSNRYAWDLSPALIGALARKHQVSPENLLLGAGSMDMIDVVVRAAGLGSGTLVVPSPSFTVWSSAATEQGLRKVEVPLTADKHIDLLAMARAIGGDTRLVYICNPNNPTGTVCDSRKLLDFVKSVTRQTMVIVDEAYLDYTREPSLVAEAVVNKNVVVLKTFSKVYGMAGARVGYAIGHAKTISNLSALLCWPNGGLGSVSLAGAIASLEDRAFFQDTIARNEAARRFTMEQLIGRNMVVIPSQTNFLYFSLADYKGDYFERLKTAQVLGTGLYEEKGRWTRITIGTMEEMQRFVAAI